MVSSVWYFRFLLLLATFFTLSSAGKLEDAYRRLSNLLSGRRTGKGSGAWQSPPPQFTTKNIDLCTVTVQSFNYKDYYTPSPPKKASSPSTLRKTTTTTIAPSTASQMSPICEYSYGSWSKCTVINGTLAGRQFRLGRLVGQRTNNANGTPSERGSYKYNPNTGEIYQNLSSSLQSRLSANGINHRSQSILISRNFVPRQPHCEDRHTQERECYLSSAVAGPSTTYPTKSNQKNGSNKTSTNKEVQESVCEYETASWSVCNQGKQVSVQRLRSSLISRGRSSGGSQLRCRLFRRVERMCTSAISPSYKN